jgi:hypothetical protein
MTRKDEIIAALKLEYPEIRIGGGDVYETLSPADYDKAISDWADVQLEKEAQEAAQLASKEAREAAQAKLAALGLTTDDLKALGL